MKQCKHQNCHEPVDTEADRSKPSCIYWDRLDDEKSKVVMFTSKECKHGYCSYHARILEHQMMGVGKES